MLIEIYRRGGSLEDPQYRRAGWEGGFADLVRSHGVQVDDEPVGTGRPRRTTQCARRERSSH